MSRQFIPALVLIAGVLTSPQASDALTTQTVPSIEARIHQARQGVCGRITELTRTVILPSM